MSTPNDDLRDEGGPLQFVSNLILIFLLLRKAYKSGRKESGWQRRGDEEENTTFVRKHFPQKDIVSDKECDKKQQTGIHNINLGL